MSFSDLVELESDGEFCFVELNDEVEGEEGYSVAGDSLRTSLVSLRETITEWRTNLDVMLSLSTLDSRQFPAHNIRLKRDDGPNERRMLNFDRERFRAVDRMENDVGGFDGESF